MPTRMQEMSNNQFHTVRQGDNLSKIAKQHGTTVQELSKINGISNANRIPVGRKIALKREAVCKVGFQFLDRDRNPLRNTMVRIEYCGKVTKTSTGKNGRVPDILTDSPVDVVVIWIQRAEGGWKKITEVTSDWGNKLVTFTSPKIRVEASTHPHPRDKDGLPIKDKREVKAKVVNSANQKASIPVSTEAKGKLQSTFGDEKGTKLEEKKNEQGLPVAKVTNDQAELTFLKLYTGEAVIEADWVNLAADLGCEVHALKAVTQVEAGGKGGFDDKNRPRILFERHKFSKYSKNRFDESYPFISNKQMYLRIRDKSGEIIPERKKEYDRIRKNGSLSSSNYYPPDQDTNYVRISKAYLLDKEAALLSASWGMFQVMGFNFKNSGFNSVEDFVNAMSTSEKEQIKAFAAFIKANPKLTKALKERDWSTFAINYNGASHGDYDVKMKNAYTQLSAKK